MLSNIRHGAYWWRPRGFWDLCHGQFRSSWLFDFPSYSDMTVLHGGILAVRRGPLWSAIDTTITNIQILMKYYDKSLAIFLFINLNVTCCQSYFSCLLRLMLDSLGPIFERIRSQTHWNYCSGI
jgi:hypothetical protein